MSEKNELFPQVKEDIEFDTLWTQVTQTIDTLSGENWTDTGEHDPGVTLLQAVTWNCSDLGYRTSLPLEDLLTKKGLTSKKGQSILFPEDFGPHAVLTCNTVTAQDYRRRLRDLHSSDISMPVFLNDEKNKQGFLFSDALLIKEPLDKEKSHFNWWYDADNRNYHFNEPKKIADEKKRNLTLRGNYWLYLMPTRYTLELIKNEQDNPNPFKGLITSPRAFLNDFLKNFLNNHRNVGENVSRIIWLEPVEFHPKLTIEISDDIVDINKVVAEIYQTFNQLMLPEIQRFSTQEMQEAGYASEDIFNGPLLQHGWQPDSPALISENKMQLNLSKLFNRLLAIEGIINIEDFSPGNLPTEITPVEGDCWSWEVKEHYFPLLWGWDPLQTLTANDKSTLILKSKGGIYPKAQKDKVSSVLEKITPELINNDPVTLPAGNVRNPWEYTPIGHRLPACYQLQLPNNTTDSVVTQLHQFLLPIDQCLADFCAQLTLLPQLMAFTDRDKLTVVNGFQWPYGKGTVNDNVHQDYRNTLMRFQKDATSIFLEKDWSIENFFRELGFIEFLLDYFGTYRAPRPLTLNLQDFLNTQRAYLAQQPWLGYERINIRVNKISALQKRIAARIGLGSEVFSETPNLAALPFYLIEHRQLLPLIPNKDLDAPQKPEKFNIEGSNVTFTQKGVGEKILQGQLIDIIATENNNPLNITQQLVIATTDDSFTLSTKNSQNLKNNLTWLNDVWKQGKNLKWKNSEIWLQDMDYRLNYADTQPEDNNQKNLISDDFTPFPALVSVGDKIIIRRAELSLISQEKRKNQNNSISPDEAPQKVAASDAEKKKIVATIKNFNAVTGTLLIEKDESEPDFPLPKDDWQWQWNFEESLYAMHDRFSFVVSIVLNRRLISHEDIDAQQLVNWLQQSIMSEFPTHVSLINHWLSDSTFTEFALTYQRWQNDGNPLSDDAYAIMKMLTLGHLPVQELSLGRMRIATPEQRQNVLGANENQWNLDAIAAEELFYIPQI